MALDTQYIQLDISKQPTPQQVRLGQGDANATQLVVSIFDDGEAYSLTGYSVRLCMRLPKNGGYYDVDGTKSGNVATFDIDESYAASVSGFDGFGYVDILDGDEVICSTSRFQLVVLQCASEGVDVSEQYIDSVNDAIDRAIAAAEAAEGIVLQDVPTMSTTVKGGAMVGDGLAIDDGVLSVDASTVSDGTLPVSHGGTGATTAADARTALSVYSTSDMDTALAGKAAASHTHTKSEITDFGSYLPTTGGTLSGDLTVNGDIKTSGDVQDTNGVGKYTKLNAVNGLASGFLSKSAQGYPYIRWSDANGDEYQFVIGDTNIAYQKYTGGAWSTVGYYFDSNRPLLVSDSTNVSVPGNSAFTEATTLDIPSSGIYELSYGGAFASNSTGFRSVYLSVMGSGRYSPAVAAVNGEQTRLGVSHLYSFSAATTVTLYAKQSSGLSLTFYPYIRAVRIA